MLVDVVSKSFPDVVKVVQKLENTVFVFSPTMCGVAGSTWELMSTVSAGTLGLNYDLMLS